MNTSATRNRAVWGPVACGLLASLGTLGCDSASKPHKAVLAFVGKEACGARAAAIDAKGDEAILSQAPACPQNHAAFDDGSCAQLTANGPCVAHGRDAKDGPDLVDYCLTRTGEDFKVDAACTTAASLVRKYFAADDCGARKALVFAPEENASQLSQLAARQPSCKASVVRIDVAACAGALHASGGRCVAKVELTGGKSANVCVRRDDAKLSVDLRCTETLDGPDGRRALVKPGKRYDAAHPEHEFQSLELTLPGVNTPQLTWLRKDDAREAVAKLRSVTAPTPALLVVRPERERTPYEDEDYGKLIQDRWVVVDVVGEGHWQPKTTPVPEGRCPAGMAYVPASTMMLGRDEPAARATKLDAYCIDRTEVTAAAYKECMSEKKCTGGGFMSYCNSEKPDRAEHPMNCTDWSESKTFCEANGKRLPTEAEWEYAGRGPDGREYPWGDAKPAEQLCWSGVTERRSSCPVGSYPAGNSPFGVSDLGGNVSEWTATPAGSGSYVNRGSGWYPIPSMGRDEHLAESHTAPGVGRNINLGFRCAASPLR